MKVLEKLKVGVVLAIGLLTACGMNKQSQNNEIVTEVLIFTETPEPVKGKVDVYETMARAAKYNVDDAAQNLRKKIYNQNPNLKPQEIIDNIISGDVNGQSRLFAASRVLEFATIYAFANLEKNQLTMDNYFYAKAGQHLATAAIKVHQDAWFASRKFKETSRLLRAENKKAEALAQKDDAGKLSAEDEAYKQGLDAVLLKLDDYQKGLIADIAAYEKLTKMEPKDVKLEGRRFYELDSFGEGYTIGVFQEAALRNRKEFEFARDNIKDYSLNDVQHTVLHDYPLVKRLDINGFEVEDGIYEKALYDKVMALAEKLLEDVWKLRQSKIASVIERKMQKSVFDDLAAAIFTQAEVAYRLVEQADMALVANSQDIEALKKAVRKLEKVRHPSVDEKVALLNDKLALFILEQKESQIKAERAMALRTLYFNAGFPFLDKTVLRGRVAEISKKMRDDFGKNLIEITAAIPSAVKTRPLMEQSGWAQGDNWLESVVSEGRKYQRSRGFVAQKNVRLMQLGAYESVDSAKDDWQMMSNRFVSLKDYNPQIEEASVNGNKWYRLRIYGASDALNKMCKELKLGNLDCFLQ